MSNKHFNLSYQQDADVSFTVKSIIIFVVVVVVVVAITITVILGVEVAHPLSRCPITFMSSIRSTMSSSCQRCHHLHHMPLYRVVIIVIIIIVIIILSSRPRLRTVGQNLVVLRHRIIHFPMSSGGRE